MQSNIEAQELRNQNITTETANVAYTQERNNANIETQENQFDPLIYHKEHCKLIEQAFNEAIFFLEPQMTTFRTHTIS